MVVPEQVQPRTHRGQHFVDHGLAGVHASTGRIERARGLVREEHVNPGECFARDHFLAHEVPAFVVAALAQFHRASAHALPPRGRQKRHGRVIPARRKRTAERGNTPRSDLVRSTVLQVVQGRCWRFARHRASDDVKIFVVAFDPVDWSGRREVLAVVAGDVAHLNPQRHVGVSADDVGDGVKRAVNVT